MGSQENGYWGSERSIYSFVGSNYEFLNSYEMEKSSPLSMKSVSIAFKTSREPIKASDNETKADSNDEHAMIAKYLLWFASKRCFNNNISENKTKSSKLIERS